MNKITPTSTPARQLTHATIELPSISKQIWDMKYRFRATGPSEIPDDETPADTFRRVAKTLASRESESAYWEEVFFQAMSELKFLPAGRILSGAGTARRVTLFNCFVMGRIGDDMTSIFDNLKEAALTMQQGGGIGYDFSSIRPRGALVKGVGADASGPLSFMDVWDAMCQTIMSAGSRRGAMMSTLRCDHPDIEDFIVAKQNRARMRNFNLSVLITEKFMQALEQGGSIDLHFDGKVYRTVKAEDLWNKIMRATYDFAEPGVLFIDRINNENNLRYAETIFATNPCGEVPLPPYGACLLGSINLARLVDRPFTSHAKITAESLSEVVSVAVRALDNVIDLSGFPLEEQRQEALAKRRMGLGITGLADALIQCRVKYGSEESLRLTEQWMTIIRNAAYDTSIKLAREKGSFPLLDKRAYLDAPNIKALPQGLQTKINRYGIRNALLTSIAPTGTISLFAANVSSGLEPTFAFEYTRHVKQKDGSTTSERVRSYSATLYRDLFGEEGDLPDFFVSAQTLAPRDHVLMQGLIQRFVDASISKTVNVPETISFDDFQNIYRLTYQSGCKGCTTYRPNEVTGSVLSVEAPKVVEPKRVIEEIEPAAVTDGVMQRCDVLQGETYKIKWPTNEHAMYITINDIQENGVARPFELFINSKNMEHYSWTIALTRMISAIFRHNRNILFVVDELKAVFDPQGGHWMPNVLRGTGRKFVPSVIAAIGEVIEAHMHSIGFIKDDEDVFGLSSEAVIEVVQAHPSNGARTCGKCGQPTLIREEGCEKCLSCGYSKCS